VRENGATMGAENGEDGKSDAVLFRSHLEGFRGI